MVINKLLALINLKSNLVSHKYLFFFIPLVTTPMILHNLCKQLKLFNIKYQILKKIKFDIKKMFNFNLASENFFINGSYFIIYSNELTIINKLQIDNLRLILLSYKNFFINNQFFINLNFYESFFNNNWHILLLYINYFVNIYFWILFYIQFILIMQFNIYCKSISNFFNLTQFNDDYNLLKNTNNIIDNGKESFPINLSKKNIINLNI